MGIAIAKPNIGPDTCEAMIEDEIQLLPAEQQIAIRYIAPELRNRFSTILLFDARMGRIVGQTTEPMLGQMRLAWWRDMVKLDLNDRPNGDAVLDAIGQHTAGLEVVLERAVDGWEELLATETLTATAVSSFVACRTALLNAIVTDEVPPSLDAATRQWAFADLLARTTTNEDRSLIAELAGDTPPAEDALPRALRGIAVLSALGRRSLARGGRPLMEGRGAALTAMRAGLIGK